MLVSSGAELSLNCNFSEAKTISRSFRSQALVANALLIPALREAEAKQISVECEASLVYSTASRTVTQSSITAAPWKLGFQVPCTQDDMRAEDRR